ncbi:MAG: rhodanese-like domain-containing protein [Rhodospirillales bacterium]|nr:rhodanese-like domain-containing protein [Rhodospirillales bacterium]
MPTTLKDMMAEASAAAPRLSPDQVAERLREGAVLLDVRDPNEVAASGRIAGAVCISRGMLEFRADPGSPMHHTALQRATPVLVYCASGGRSALAARTLRELGYAHVFNAGGFKELADSGLPIERD